MLRFKADRRSLAFIGTYFSLITLQWFANIRALWIAVPLLAVTCMVSWTTAVITHNTLHSPMFRSRWLNKVMQVVLTLTYGFPVSEYIPGHNLSHHRFTQTRRDVMRTTKARHRWNALNGLLFFGAVAGDVFAANMAYAKAMSRRQPRWFRQLLIEMIACWGTKVVLLVIDWRKALLFIFLPHAYALWGITSVNYVQHDGCDPESEYNQSRNFVGRIFNWFTFNNGFHAMHHVEPGLHWSLLAEAHAKQVEPFTHPALNQKSLLVYVMRTFIWPGRRVRFDGLPVVVPPPAADETWIPTPEEAASVASLGAEAA